MSADPDAPRRRPVVVVSGPDRGGAVAWLFTAWSILRAGGWPIRVRPGHSRPRRPWDALVLGGGADVSAPTTDARRLAGSSVAANRRAQTSWRRRALSRVLYVLRRKLGRRSSSIDPARDELELNLLDEAAREDRPVLGICRGAQLMNVFAGGTLRRDLAGFYVEHPQPWTALPRKEVEITPGSHLACVLGRTRDRVNSLHRHAVAEVGDGLTIAARERNGVVQAIERDHRAFWIGVQWHPEYLLRSQGRLFEALVEAARG